MFAICFGWTRPQSAAILSAMALHDGRTPSSSSRPGFAASVSPPGKWKTNRRSFDSMAGLPSATREGLEGRTRSPISVLRPPAAVPSTAERCPLKGVTPGASGMGRFSRMAAATSSSGAPELMASETSDTMMSACDISFCSTASLIRPLEAVGGTARSP